MKQISLALCAIALMVGAYSCSGTGKKSEATTEVDSLGIPVTVSSLILGDTVKIDTLYASEDNVYRMIDNNEYMQRFIFDNNGLIMYNPTLQVDSLGGASYKISDLMTTVDVDFANAESVEAFKKAFPYYDKFKIVTYSDLKQHPRNIVYSLSVSVPTEEIKDYKSIESWVAGDLDTIPFDGSFRNLGHRLAAKFFESFEDVPENFELYEAMSDIAYWMTTKYVTYFDTYSTYSGGAHGMYGYNFQTYLFDENAPLTKEMLLREGTDEEVLDLIFDAMANDRDFATNHNINTGAQARKYVMSYLLDGEVPIPNPGLLRDGVVFCYQPYELGCYADGAFQLVIPYSKLAPYMTETGKRLIR